MTVLHWAELVSGLHFGMLACRHVVGLCIIIVWACFQIFTDIFSTSNSISACPIKQNCTSHRMFLQGVETEDQEQNVNALEKWALLQLKHQICYHFHLFHGKVFIYMKW